MESKEKIIIYQVLPRLFGNDNRTCQPWGSNQVNGCGHLADFTPRALEQIRSLGATHVWYTGLIEHASQTDYSLYGIAADHKAVVKGIAGSPYAIRDYYDIDPDLATSIPARMAEFEALVERTHAAGMKVLIDFVPNHVARQYKSICRPSRPTTTSTTCLGRPSRCKESTRATIARCRHAQRATTSLPPSLTGMTGTRP